MALGNGRGRPRRGGTDDAILTAAIELLAERGLEGTTMNAIIERSGVSRATVYLRWPRRSTLIVAAVRKAMARPVMTLSGDLEADLRSGAEQARAILGSVPFQAVLPAFIEALVGHEPGSDRMSIDLFLPGRATLADEYSAIGTQSGMRAALPGELVVDVLVGGLLFRHLATGTAPSERDVADALDIVLNGARRASTVS